MFSYLNFNWRKLRLIHLVFVLLFVAVVILSQLMYLSPSPPVFSGKYLGPYVQNISFSRQELHELQFLDDAEPSELSNVYHIISSHCKIPKAPFVVNDARADWSEIEAEKCTDEDDVTHLDTTTGKITFNQNKYEGCCYRIISRPYQMESDWYTLSSPCRPLFYNDIVPNEYFITICTYRGIRQKRFRVHATIPIEKPTIVEKIKYWTSNFPSESKRPPSVLMLALDSTSRVNAYRSLPETMNLLKKLAFIDFKGHHVLGEPTLTNAIPLLIGAPSRKEFVATTKTSWESPWDDYSFIWKKFNLLKYLTFYSEDSQTIGTFQYGGQTGFTFQPCDIYLRPLFLVHEDKAQRYGTKVQCFANETIAEFILNHHLNFLRQFKGIPNFSLNWLTWPQHDNFKVMPVLDEYLFNFFSKLSAESEILKNTVIIVFSDHGVWREAYAETKIGILERKLPLLFIRYPENLSLKYPEHKENLNHNAHTLTSHHDTYQTLIHIAEMGNGSNGYMHKSDDEFRYSLLQEIPKNRTCKDAHIPDFACACV